MNKSYYFLFQILQSNDGSVIRYSPNWCGSRSKVAKNEKALLYNDLEFWGIGKAEGDYIPDDVKVLQKDEAVKLIAQTYHINSDEVLITEDDQIEFRTPVKDIDGVYCGEKLIHRWDGIPTEYCNDFIIDFTDIKNQKSLGYSKSTGDTLATIQPVPERITKNLKSKYFNQFIATGELLVSSISRFRIMGGEGQDEKEGVKVSDIYIDSNTPKELKAEEFNKYTSHFRFEGNGKIEINGNIVVKDKAYLPDVYVFCASSKVLSKFGDAHFEIVNVNRFGQTLYETIRKQIDKEVYYWMVAPVVYGGDKDPIRTLYDFKHLGGFNINVASMLDCFYKPSSYSDEEEIRFVFFTKKKSIQPSVVVNNKNLIKCCKY